MTTETLVITGAGGDIGYAVASRMASPQTRVLLVDVDLPKLHAVEDAIRGMYREIAAVECDVSSESGVVHYSNVAQEFGRGSVERFFNNAGVIGAVAPLTEYPAEVFDHVLAVNARGVFLGLKHIGPLLKRGAAVVNTSSVGGLTGQRGLAAYVASKHAVLGLTRTAALEWADRGVRVNAICPGPVAGQMMDVLFEGLDLDPDDRAAAVPIGRLAVPQDIAESVAFLMSAAAGHITGTTITVDGGRQAG
jgi:NAD(P)-dependent dehydrogenase (short-subunit alcohol dehydrogenase family)